MSRKIVIMAGGTGGHVFPGLAVAHRMQAVDWQIHWLGTPDRMEADLVPAHGFPIEFINIRGLRNHGLLRKLQAPFQIGKAIFQALSILRRIKPDVVLGMGGYASGPGGIAAKLLGIPLVLHEQNAAAGLTNRMLSKIATRILMGFDGAFPLTEHARVVGNPVRDEFLHLAQQPLKHYQYGAVLKVLIVGGSLGARPLNQIVPNALAKVNNIDIRHQCGKGNAGLVSDLYQSLGVTTVMVSEFISDMSAAYEWADLLICRAGALTVAEVAATGIPAIFVPLPHAVDDHQTRNAESLTSRNAAILIPQKEMTADKLAALISTWQTDPRPLHKMAQYSRAAAILNATDRVVSECEALI